MANIYTLKSGLASDTSVWSSGTVPVSGDRVLICSGHTVTIDGTYTWGDDSTSTVAVNSISTTASIYVLGVLKASRTVSSQLSCMGHLLVAAGAAGMGYYDAGTEADPIPSGITHTLVLNGSSSLASGKYGFELGSSGTGYQGRCSFHGVARKRNPVLVSAVAVGAVSATISDATGWAVGDQVVFAPTSAFNAEDVRTVTSLVSGAGGQATIGFSALTYAHAVGAPVGNLTSNVIIKPYSSAGAGWFYMLLAVAFTGAGVGLTGYVHLCNTRIEGAGGNSGSVNKFGALNIYQNTYATTIDVYNDFSGLVFYAAGTGGGATYLLSTMYCRQRCKVINTAFYGPVTGLGGAIFEGGNSVFDWTDTVIYRSSGLGAQSSYGQGGCNHAHAGGYKLFGCAGFPLQYNVGFSPSFKDVEFGPVNTTGYFFNVVTSKAVFERCNFGALYGAGAAARAMAGSMMWYTTETEMTDCLFAAGITTRPASFVSNLASSILTIKNKNANPLYQEIHRPAGSFYRDNDTHYRSTSSIRLEADSAATSAATLEIPFLAPNGEAKKITGYLRRNAAYGASTLPSVTISGLGITPVTYTMSGASEAWEKFELTVTQTSGADGNLTLSFAGQSAAGGYCWLDGITFAPFVTSCRHYGYVFDPTSVTRKVDAVAVLSEAAALALSGLAVDFTAKTLTVTGSRTLSEIYDWVHATLCATAALAQPEFFTSVDGVNYTCTFDLVINGGAITGSGALAMAAHTLTISNGGTSVPLITHNAGVLAAIELSGLVVGSRVQVYDLTAGAELANEVATATTLRLPKTWSANHNIRTRVTYCAGTTAMLPWSQVGIFGASGLAVLVAQAVDTVYADNAIDGSVVTEFSPDYTNVQVDISDSDGVTSAQRLYAWLTYNSTLPAGIAAYFGAMTADDDANYGIAVDTLDLHLQNVGTNAVVISGARIYRDDGTSIFVAGTGPIQAEPGRAFVAADIRDDVAAVLTLVSA